MATLTEYIGSRDIDIGVTQTYTAFAQSFKIPSSSIITGFSILSYREADVTATTFTAKIIEGGVTPTFGGTEKASEVFDISSLTSPSSAIAYTDFTFSSDTGIVTGGTTQYYLYIYINQSSTGQVVWAADNTSPSYSDGKYWFYSNGTWADNGGVDYNFKIYGANASNTTNFFQFI